MHRALSDSSILSLKVDAPYYPFQESPKGSPRVTDSLRALLITPYEGASLSFALSYISMILASSHSLQIYPSAPHCVRYRVHIFPPSRRLLFVPSTPIRLSVLLSTRLLLLLLSLSFSRLSIDEILVFLDLRCSPTCFSSRGKKSGARNILWRRPGFFQPLSLSLL
ncbi:uncharacterized protein BDV17DRAFT_47792 [Aspergillus undulatus]|uniref:uncharacterized protein n=1 Tax=Aspergillus undulatus TaxID=1810928 RepID=UPI003CCE36DA